MKKELNRIELAELSNLINYIYDKKIDKWRVLLEVKNYINYNILNVEENDQLESTF